MAAVCACLLVIIAESAVKRSNGCACRSIFCVNGSIAVVVHVFNKRSSLDIIACNYHDANAVIDCAVENFIRSLLNLIVVIIRFFDKTCLSFGVKIDFLCLFVCLIGNKCPESEKSAENGGHKLVKNLGFKLFKDNIAGKKNCVNKSAVI